MARLDNRKFLYGEPRLSDAQVLALRAAARAGLTETAEGYSDGTRRILFKVVQGRAMHHLLERLEYGVVVATARGRRVLADIDAAAAPSTARSDTP